MAIISQRTRLFPALRKRIREYDMNQSEAAGLIGMNPSTFSHKMSGRIPWTEPEMQRVLRELGRPEENLGDLFLRRAI